MDKPSDAPMMMAPGQASGVAEMRLPGRDEQPRRRPPTRDKRPAGPPGGEQVEPWPAVDDYLDEPELSRWERIDGERMWASPAKLEHGAPHFQLDYLLGAHTREAYIGAVDLKTRVAPTKEHASDTCLVKDGIDPRTGRRHLEELSFEVVNERSQHEVDVRARAFAARGVRRQIAIYVKTGVVAEWDNARQTWRPLDPEQRIFDPCLSHPLSVAALLDAALADDEVARALEAKGNPAIVEMKTKSREEGRKEGREEGREEGRQIALRGYIKDLCGILSIAWSEQRQAAVRRMSLSALEALREYLVSHKTWPEERAADPYEAPLVEGTKSGFQRRQWKVESMTLTQTPPRFQFLNPAPAGTRKGYRYGL